MRWRSGWRHVLRRASTPLAWAWIRVGESGEKVQKSCICVYETAEEVRPGVDARVSLDGMRKVEVKWRVLKAGQRWSGNVEFEDTSSGNGDKVGPTPKMILFPVAHDLGYAV